MDLLPLIRTHMKNLCTCKQYAAVESLFLYINALMYLPPLTYRLGWCVAMCVECVVVHVAVCAVDKRFMLNQMVCEECESKRGEHGPE